MMATTFHRVRSSHPEDDAEGRTFGPGELVPNLDLTSDEFKEFNSRKVEEGIFYPVDEDDAIAEVEAAAGPEVTDAAAKLAAENSVDLDSIVGSGKDNRIIESDVQAALDARPEDDDNNDEEGND